MYRTKEQIKSELSTAREKLEKAGRIINRDNVNRSEGGIKCDFELPYSSLPKLMGRKQFLK